MNIQPNFPICSMVHVWNFSYIYHQFKPNVDIIYINIPYMEQMGDEMTDWGVKLATDFAFKRGFYEAGMTLFRGHTHTCPPGSLGKLIIYRAPKRKGSSSNHHFPGAMLNFMCVMRLDDSFILIKEEFEFFRIWNWMSRDSNQSNLLFWVGGNSNIFYLHPEN